MGPTAGAQRAPMQGPEGSLCRAALGFGVKGPAQVGSPSLGLLGLGLGRHVLTIPSLGRHVVTIPSLRTPKLGKKNSPEKGGKLGKKGCEL